MICTDTDDYVNTLSTIKKEKKFLQCLVIIRQLPHREASGM